MLEWEEISPVLIATYELLDECPNGAVRDQDVERLLPDMDHERVRHASPDAHGPGLRGG